jgi:tRNA(Ile)-lysidine synthase
VPASVLSSCSLPRSIFYNARMRPEYFAAAVHKTVLRFGMDVVRPLAMVSGGPDSVAMLRVLLELGVEPVVLHVDHGLRAEESREDAKFVEELCENLSVPYEARRIGLSGTNLQEGAREERYRLAEEVAEGRGLSAVATGHIADDVAETVLLNLARGAGMRGLSGIPPVRGLFARPLIERRRAEVLAYLEALEQPYRTDPTNLTPKYARNRVRLEVLPALEKLYPGASGNISRAASLLREDLGTLEDIAAGSVRRRGGEIVVPLRPFRTLPHALRRYAVRRAYRETLPGAPPLGSALIEAVLGLAKSGEGTKTLDLPGGAVVAARPEEFAFYSARASFEGEEEVREGELKYAGWLVGVRRADGFDARDAARPEVAYLDAAFGPYRVRMAREGDSIRASGLGGSKKVMRAMMDRKVPRDLRRRTPVVVDGAGKVAWIFSGELSEDHKVDGATERALRLEVRERREDDRDD